jgi:hypothetical protein
MPTSTLIIILLAIAVAALTAWIIIQNRRSRHLRTRFGPEYERTLAEHGERKKAEEILTRREERVERFRIKALSPEDRSGFLDAWKQQQARFVDDPSSAVIEADRLVADVMHRRGYPVGDFEQRAADISVQHPRVVENYRAAHAIAVQQERGRATTEDLRKAMVHYRALFADLVETHEVESGVR